MKPYPDVTSVVEAVCGSLNEVAAEAKMYSEGTTPVSSADILYEPSKYRAHSDVRVVSAMILRKHTLLPSGFEDEKQPTIEWISQKLLGRGRGGGIVIRMANMCELIRVDERYRRIYIGALTRIMGREYALFNIPKDIRNATPC